MSDGELTSASVTVALPALFGRGTAGPMAIPASTVERLGLTGVLMPPDFVLTRGYCIIAGVTFSSVGVF